ncbi:MAG TPA: hypothetical protein VLK56_05655, partial [Solirubrobacterales bacterium]|nr:hypothetical protein [Solirubrobacterales bacterium]
SVLVSGIQFPHGLAVDQANHRVYVAVASDDGLNHAHGEIRRFESTGQAAGSFPGGPEAFFTGVAVNPVTQGFYGAQVRVETPIGSFGTAQMDPFSSTGVAGAPFPLSVNNTLPQIAADSAGDVFFPNDATNSVQVFDSAGVLRETIGCSGCPGGAFGKPVSVAIGSEDALYVVDLAPDRVVKLTPSGGSYQFDSVLQSGRGAVAVGVDPSADDVFVGDLPNGSGYHIVAYDSSGAQFDDFGGGLFTNPQLGPTAAAQIAADATTHELYVSETEKIYIFERVPIGPPSATVGSASTVGQLTATLNATVNANGHAALECEFELTEAADLSFANATPLPCSQLPDGTLNTAVSANAPGLTPETSYRYRVTATTNGGSVTSGSSTFATLAETPPTATTNSPKEVGQTSAVLEGAVNPQGGSVTDCHFDFGPSVSYGSSTACSSMPGPLTTAVAVARKISPLTPATAYHYRLVVTTNAGTAKGDDVAFATAGPPPVSTPPATPPAPLPTLAPVSETGAGSPPPECEKGFRRQLTATGTHCVKVCRKGFRRQRIRGQVRCVKRNPPHRRRRVHAGR